MTKYRLTKAAMIYFGVSADEFCDIRENTKSDSIYPFLGTFGDHFNMPLRAREVEVVEENPVGRRVRCTNDSRFNGLEGTVVALRGQMFEIEWEREIENLGHGGLWSEGSFEFIEDEPEPDLAAEIERLLQVIDQKNAALTLAEFTFGFYADSHMKKETDESTMKAFTNIALRRAMLDAIEIN